MALKKGGPISLSVHPIATSVFKVGEELDSFLISHLRQISLEGKVLAITSKIVSLAERQVLAAAGISKQELIRQEADFYLGSGLHGVELTIKHGILVPSAGIDESNSENGDYILYPKDPYESAKKIWLRLREAFHLKSFGLIITDSHTLPLRRGVVGIALSHWGFQATRSLVDHPDIFKRPLKFTHVNVVDSLAVMAVFAMGEANEQKPLALIGDSGVVFTDSSSSSEIKINSDDDLYAPLIRNQERK